MILYYIRHGDPIYEPDSLTPLGERQAEAVGRRLALHGMDQIYSSTSKRALQTAQPLCDLLKKEVVQLDWCNEKYAFHDLSVVNSEGKRVWGVDDPETRRIMNCREVRDLTDHWYDHPAFANTNFKSGLGRIGRETDSFLDNLGYHRDCEQNCYIANNHNDQRVALFAHWGAGGAIISHILGIPYPMFALHFTMSHSSVTVFEFAPRNGIVLPKIISYGNDSHIYKEGLPTKFVNRLYY